MFVCFQVPSSCLRAGLDSQHGMTSYCDRLHAWGGISEMWGACRVGIPAGGGCHGQCCPGCHHLPGEGAEHDHPPLQDHGPRRDTSAGRPALCGVSVRGCKHAALTRCCLESREGLSSPLQPSLCSPPSPFSCCCSLALGTQNPGGLLWRFPSHSVYTSAGAISSELHY